MNYFQHQDQARKRTTQLVFLLLASVCFLIAITIFAIGFFLYWLQGNSSSFSAYHFQSSNFTDHMLQLSQSPIALWVSVGVCTLVGLGSLFKWLQLGSGGKRIAQSLGGKLIDPSSSAHLDRKILNVVEEMAIASGNPVPPVYVLEDDSINAFAAGLHRRDAVIGVTRGTIKYLSRDELQGVIAHEFSHIHNGDMRLNMKLIALLHGILMIGLAGELLLRGSSTHRGSFSQSRKRDNGYQIGLGVALLAIGYGGTFFGGLIKAAVSRQREFLADASAVQFTRNPTGISGALKKIGGLSSGSAISHKRAGEFSHFYFGSGIKHTFGSFMATHPPLKDRIKRIEPRWDGDFPNVEVLPPLNDNEAVSALHKTSPSQNKQPLEENKAIKLQTSIENAGDPSKHNLEAGDILLFTIPCKLKDAAHQAFSARALVYALLLHPNASIRDNQIKHLKMNAHPATFKQFEHLQPSVSELPPAQRFTLINLCSPALKQQSPPQLTVFKKNVLALIKADTKISLFEWCLYRITLKNADSMSVPTHFIRSISSARKHVEKLMLAVAQYGKTQHQLEAYNEGRKAIGLEPEQRIEPIVENFVSLDKSLDILQQLAPLQKPKLLKAIAAIIEFDEIINQEEEVLLRVISDALDCPIPPTALS